MKYGPSKMIGQRQPRNWPDYHKTWDLDNLFPSVRQSPLSGPFPLLTTLIIIWWFAFMIFSNLPFFFPSCMCAKSLQSCPTLCDPMDYSPPGFSVHGILQTRILKWVGRPSFRGTSWPRDWTCVFYVFCIGRQILYHSVQFSHSLPLNTANKNRKSH